MRQRGAAATDRYGRILAYAYVAGGPDRSAAHDMLARGFARVAARVGDRACAAELLAQERAARDAGLGLWAEPYYSIVGGRQRGGASGRAGPFYGGTGQGVVGPRERGHNIYEFRPALVGGADRYDLETPGAHLYVRREFAPKGLENRHVRVRGWVEERNGPRIEAANPEQIEIVERN